MNDNPGFSNDEVELGLMQQGLQDCSKLVAELSKNRSQITAPDSLQGILDTSVGHTDRVSQAITNTLASLEKRLLRVEERFNIGNTDH